MMYRTLPKIVGWEQTNESVPWYTKSGRLEFYRDEDEFIEYGENMPLHREPVDGTQYEPGVLMATPHPLIDPAQPEQYGLDIDDLSVEVRQVRHVVRTPDEIAGSHHPLWGDGFTHVLVTPKFRHACHSMGASTDADVLIFGPFGDFYRHDKRKPWISEGYVDLNPADAVDLGVADGATTCGSTPTRRTDRSRDGRTTPTTTTSSAGWFEQPLSTPPSCRASLAPGSTSTSPPTAASKATRPGTTASPATRAPTTRPATTTEAIRSSHRPR